VSHAFDSLYLGCVRPLCLEFFSVIIAELVKKKTSPLILDIVKQYKSILKRSTYRVTRNLRQFLFLKFKRFIYSRKKYYKSYGFTIQFSKTSAFIYKDPTDTCIFTINFTEQKAQGLTQLYCDSKTGVFVHEITFSNPCVEFYMSMLCMLNKTPLYCLKDVMFELDSIYIHEKQHVYDDVIYKTIDTSRSDAYYNKILKKDSDFYYSKYLHHPVELAANMQQLAFLLHMLRPSGTIDATRFLNFFKKYKISKYSRSFLQSEVCKYKVLFSRNKNHTKYWFKFMFKLLNMKYYQLYGRNILVNVNQCISSI